MHRNTFALALGCLLAVSGCTRGVQVTPPPSGAGDTPTTEAFQPKPLPPKPPTPEPAAPTPDGARAGTVTRGKAETRLLHLAIVPSADSYRATVRFSGLLPADKELRIAYLVAEAAKGVTDVAQVGGSGSIGAGVTEQWYRFGGVLEEDGEYRGFLVDVSPQGRDWAEAAPGTIEVPLSVDPLFPDMTLDRPGVVLVAFVDVGKDGDQKVAVTNTVSVAFQPKAKPTK